MKSWFTLVFKEKNDKIAELEKQMAMKAGHHEKKARSPVVLFYVLLMVVEAPSSMWGGVSASEQRNLTKQKEINTKLSKGWRGPNKNAKTHI